MYESELSSPLNSFTTFMREINRLRSMQEKGHTFNDTHVYGKMFCIGSVKCKVN